MTFIPSHCLRLLLLFFFKISSVRIPNLLLYVLVNTSAMHFLCLSFTVGLFGIKRRASIYHMIFTDQFDRNGGSVESIYFFALFPRAHLTLVSVRQWDAKKLRRFWKQDKAWCDIVGNKLSIKKNFQILNYQVKNGNDYEARGYNLLSWSECVWKPEDYHS